MVPIRNMYSHDVQRGDLQRRCRNTKAERNDGKMYMTYNVHVGLRFAGWFCDDQPDWSEKHFSEENENKKTVRFTYSCICRHL